MLVVIQRLPRQTVAAVVDRIADRQPEPKHSCSWSSVPAPVFAEGLTYISQVRSKVPTYLR